MKVTYFFRPKMKGVFSIETLFEKIQDRLPSYIIVENYVCTDKLKRFPSFIKSIFHQSDVNHITGDIHTIALFLSKKKTILTIHDLGRYDRDLTGWKKLIKKLLWISLPLHRVKYITTISEFTKQRIIEETGINSDKIHVIPNPAPTDFTYHPKEYNSKSPRILQIGSGNNKNIDRLIKAVANSKYELILVRKPNLALEQKLKELKITYEWHYNVTREFIYQLYIKTDVLFFASEYEGFGVPILEANAVGRPIITSNISSMPFVAGNSAMLVNPYSVEEIRTALNQINENSNLRETLVKNGLKNLQKFSIEKIVADYAELYNKIHYSK
ncbi:glycosyltransferase family 1 protein [Flavobacterium sp. ASW18X]|uniref:glycosyltransferase family 4 protein n=1 Tax=Flavobacterium sp. ASW18X TaxID=2572595 RepID=UPI0010AE1BD7|nr:glycosyltransferase family 1 protein [Flavobacterium sp. ASW18X]TKD65538.1 glycosyltransferase family 4 protein [Flavobacterium sp. ASW18X]